MPNRPISLCMCVKFLYDSHSCNAFDNIYIYIYTYTAYANLNDTSRSNDFADALALVDLCHAPPSPAAAAERVRFSAEGTASTLSRNDANTLAFTEARCCGGAALSTAVDREGHGCSALSSEQKCGRSQRTSTLLRSFMITAGISSL